MFKISILGVSCFCLHLNCQSRSWLLLHSGLCKDSGSVYAINIQPARSSGHWPLPALKQLLSCSSVRVEKVKEGDCTKTHRMTNMWDLKGFIGLFSRNTGLTESIRSLLVGMSDYALSAQFVWGSHTVESDPFWFTGIDGVWWSQGTFARFLSF